MGSELRLNGRRRYLGSHHAPEEAHAVYILAAEEAFGEYARGRLTRFEEQPGSTQGWLEAAWHNLARCGA